MYCMITNLIRVIVIPLNQSNSCPNQLKSEMSYRLGVLQVRVTPERVVLKVRVLKSACCLVKYSAKDCDWERFYLCKRVVRDWSKSRSCRNWFYRVSPFLNFAANGDIVNYSVIFYVLSGMPIPLSTQ